MYKGTWRVGAGFWVALGEVTFEGRGGAIHERPYFIG